MIIINREENSNGKRCILSAKLDLIFKKIFTENRDMLHSFAAIMIGVPRESTTDINITNPELPPEAIYGKFSRPDLRMNVDNRLEYIKIQNNKRSNCNFSRDMLLL